MRLLFVYNADAGLVSGMLDSIHKTISPETYECALCQLTHGLFTMDKAWRAYLQALPIESVFFHRQDFKSAYPAATFALPVILLERGATLLELVSAEQMSALGDVDALISALDIALTNAGARDVEKTARPAPLK